MAYFSHQSFTMRRAMEFSLNLLRKCIFFSRQVSEQRIAFSDKCTLGSIALNCCKRSNNRALWLPACEHPTRKKHEFHHHKCLNGRRVIFQPGAFTKRRSLYYLSKGKERCHLGHVILPVGRWNMILLDQTFMFANTLSCSHKKSETKIRVILFHSSFWI